uniref:hypothetical protein n=1 Tax=Vibrio cholerae TaxID=666 RepID=UPI003F583082
MHLTKPDSAIDDFALDIAGEDDDVSSYEDEEEGEQYDRFGLISPLPGDETGEYWLDNQRKATTAKSEGGFLIHRVEGYRNSLGALSLRCPCCQQTKVKNFEFFRYFKNGAPFMLSTVIPTLLEYCQDGKRNKRKALGMADE